MYKVVRTHPNTGHREFKGPLNLETAKVLMKLEAALDGSYLYTIEEMPQDQEMAIKATETTAGGSLAA